MIAKKKPKKKFFTPQQADAMLPLVRSIVKDISSLAHSLRDRHARIDRLQKMGGHDLHGSAHLEEEQAIWEKDADRLQECVAELQGLGVEMKDFYIGLVDFPCWQDDREICLCWKLGEDRLEWWHETFAGFAGRQPLAGTTCPENASL